MQNSTAKTVERAGLLLLQLSFDLIPIRRKPELRDVAILIYELIHVDLDMGPRFQILTLDLGSMCRGILHGCGGTEH